MGYSKGDPVNISDAFESYGSMTFNTMRATMQATDASTGAYATGTITDEERFDVVRHACPGAGACGGMYTANTMSSALEVRMILADSAIS